MQLRNYGHEMTHHPVTTSPMPQQEHDLSPREIEVLILITKGFINKEIADKLNISLTTVISHRKTLRKTRYQIGIGACHLRRHARLCRGRPDLGVL